MVRVHDTARAPFSSSESAEMKIARLVGWFAVVLGWWLTLAPSNAR